MDSRSFPRRSPFAPMSSVRAPSVRSISICRRRPIILGLTGSIGMGKSTVARLFARESLPVFDADAVVHRLQTAGSALLPLIAARFPGVVGVHGVDRAALGAMVLGDAVALAALEAMIHPMIAQQQQRFIRRNRGYALLVLDIPLLFEKGGWRNVDATATVSAPLWLQRRRVIARPNMTRRKFESINRLQLPDQIKRRRCDFVIPTNCPISETRAVVRDIIACFRRRASQYRSL